jgi:hypothetical protein
MAATYTTLFAGVQWPASVTNKVMCQFWNAAASTQTARIYRIWVLNTATTSAGVYTAGTGVLMPYMLRKITAISSVGTPSTAGVSTVKHDTGSAALNANITLNHANTTWTGTEVLWNGMLSTDEPKTGVLTKDELHALAPIGLIWDSGYGDSNVEPLTLPAGVNSGIAITTPGLAAGVGYADFIFEYTLT